MNIDQREFVRTYCMVHLYTCTPLARITSSRSRLPCHRLLHPRPFYNSLQWDLC